MGGDNYEKNYKGREDRNKSEGTEERMSNEPTMAEKQQKAELLLKYGDRIVDKKIREVMAPKEAELDAAQGKFSALQAKHSQLTSQLQELAVEMIQDHLKNLVDLEALNALLKPIGMEAIRIESYGDRYDYRIDSQKNTLTITPQLATAHGEYFYGTPVTFPVTEEYIELQAQKDESNVECNTVYTLVQTLKCQTDNNARNQIRNKLKDAMTDNVLEYLNGDFQDMLPALPAAKPEADATTK